MTEVEIIFIFQTIEENIKCKTNEIMLDILERFADTKDKNAEDFIFLYDGKTIDIDLTLEEMTKGNYNSPILATEINSDSKINNEINELTIIYSIKKEKNYLIRIFGDKFVENNKNKCKIFINGNEQEICNYII